jgi:crotonobetainyl-CoA:carnitine CoA-transferase CaiB-like acyl-CoA transferase
VGKDKRNGMLAPYRVLDLTNERGFICGKLLGDLGADVIKIEKPGGDPARRIGPFYHNIPDPEKSLYWWAFNINKRGITLNIETADGHAIFKNLVKTADFVIESFDPGYLDKLGLGYSSLSRINPGIILTSITGFGQAGPYKNYRAPDLVVWALSGEAYMTGDADRAPLRPNFPVAYIFGALQGAVGTVVALSHRNITGKGQHVDASAQLSLVWPTGPEVQGLWDTDKTIVRRSGRMWQRPQIGVAGSTVKHVSIPLIYQCKDGSVRFFPFVDVGMLPSTKAMTQWIIEEGMANSTVKQVDWEVFNWQTASQETVDEIAHCFTEFFLRRSKHELWEQAQKRGIQLYPLLTPGDMLEFEQLKIRGYWEQVEHPELATTITYPGAIARMSEVPCGTPRRAPLIGEHNEEIYMGEMGISREELLILKQGSII